MPTSESKPIALTADIVSLDDTRAVTQGAVLTETSMVGETAAVWFTNTKGAYPENATPSAPTFIPFHATVKYENGPTTVYVNPTSKLDALTYPTTLNTPIYCVGLYPADAAWILTNGNTVAERDIDGKTDIMFTPQQEGLWDKPFTNQTYKHQLMWIKLEARATDPEAIEHWGKITKIELSNINTKIAITLDTGVVIYSIPGKVITAEDVELTVTAENVGSVLCAPTNKLTMTVTSEFAGEKTYEVMLKDEAGNEISGTEEEIIAKTRGKLFIINLYFNAFDNIDATCNLIPWNEQNVDLN